VLTIRYLMDLLGEEGRERIPFESGDQHSLADRLGRRSLQRRDGASRGGFLLADGLGDEGYCVKAAASRHTPKAVPVRSGFR
jgi:hypothetical protein